MSFDGLLLHHLTNEFQQLQTGRITKIYQLSQYDLLFNINANKKKLQLLISASPNYARIHLTEFTHERPETPPNFCMFLRKYLEGGIIKSISQHLTDRVITFDIEKRNELGDLAIKKLIIEVTGRHSNIIITDHDYKILEAIKHIMPFDGTTRTIYPSAIYKYPSIDKVDPFNDILRNQTLDFLESIDEKTLIKTFQGVSPTSASEIINKQIQGTSIKEAFKKLLYDVSPVIIDGDKEYFYYTDLTGIEGTKKHFNTVNEMVDRYYYNRDSIDIIRQRSKDIIKFIKNQIEKQQYKIEKLQKDIKKAEKRESFKIKGELIQANMYSIKKGDTLLKTINYYDNTPIEIALDPKKDAIENMEQYFKKYKKLKTSIPYLEKEIKKAKRELTYFNELYTQLEFASLKDIEEIKEELEENKYLKQKVKKKKRKLKPNYETYIDNDGIEILVGKNNIQNNYITHHLAHHTDVWFHTKNAPGSHVVVKHSFPLSETTIRTAAQLAAYFSKMKESSSVAIDYTEVRNLKKVPGKTGSFVTYNTNKTIYIDPEQDFILSLEKK